MIYLDTHVVVWLYAGSRTELSPAAREAIEGNDLLVSPMVVLELQYLFEIGRIRVAAETIVGTLAQEIGLRVCDLPFAQVAVSALEEGWTRDPFDRIIVGQARVRNLPLISKDGHIQSNYLKTLWG